MTGITAGSIPDRWYSARLALVAQALTAVGAVGAGVADEIQADVRLAVAVRHRLDAHWAPGPERARPAPPPASWRAVPVGQPISIQADGLRRDLPLVAYLGPAFPTWTGPGKEPILRPPEPEIPPSPRILQRATDRDVDWEAAD